jgi:hypothetical protein
MNATVDFWSPNVMSVVMMAAVRRSSGEAVTRDASATGLQRVPSKRSAIDAGLPPCRCAEPSALACEYTCASSGRSLAAMGRAATVAGLLFRGPVSAANVIKGLMTALASPVRG